MSESRWVIIGAGNIGSILLERLCSAGVAADNLLVCEEDAGRRERVSTRFGVRAVPVGDESIGVADLFLLVTPPGAVPQALRALREQLCPGQAVISFAAAVSLARLEAAVPPGVAVVRVMPSAPSFVGEGINPVAYGSSVGPRVQKQVEALLAALGRSIEVRDEQMNWCVGLTGAAMRSLLPAVLSENPIPAGLQWKDPLKGSGSGFGRGGDTSRLVPTTPSHGEGRIDSLAYVAPSPGRESGICEHDKGEEDAQCGFLASPPLPSLQPPSRPPSTAPPSCSADGFLRGN